MSNSGFRYRFQIKEKIALPNILGNHSFPVQTFRWKDVACSDNRKVLEMSITDPENQRVIDTNPFERGDNDG